MREPVRHLVETARLNLKRGNARKSRTICQRPRKVGSHRSAWWVDAVQAATAAGSRNPGPAASIAVHGFALLNVMRTYPDPLFASNAVGPRSSRFGALSQVVSVSPSRP